VRAGATAARAGADVDAGVETRDALETRVAQPAGDDMLPHSRALAGVTRSAPVRGRHHVTHEKCVPKSSREFPENR
jgi:hypothetical protein